MSYHQDNGQPSEREHLVISMTGKQSPDHWLTGQAKAIDFFTLKSEVDQLLKRLGIWNWNAKSIGRSEDFNFGLEYKSGSGSMVVFGLTSSNWLEEFDIDQPVYLADFDVKALMRLAGESETLFEELNRFPAVERDLAIVLEEQVSFDEIHSVVIKTGGESLTNVDVFDVYTNPDHLGPGRKSIALRFTIENKEATLTDREIDQWFSKMQKALIFELKADVRK
jgi:phenylalanyl-tRNA synthetase beta chain